MRDSRGIGLVVAVWKICEVIIDTRIKKAIRFHAILHSFVQLRGASTAIVEAKLQQEFGAILQEIFSRCTLI